MKILTYDKIPSEYRAPFFAEAAQGTYAIIPMQYLDFQICFCHLSALAAKIAIRTRPRNLNTIYHLHQLHPRQQST